MEKVKKVRVLEWESAGKLYLERLYLHGAGEVVDICICGHACVEQMYDEDCCACSGSGPCRYCGIRESLR